MHADLINYLCQHLSRTPESQCPSTRTRSGEWMCVPKTLFWGTHIQEGPIQGEPKP